VIVYTYQAAYNVTGNPTSGLYMYYFAGGSYEMVNNGTSLTTKIYYSFAGQAVAMWKKGTTTELDYFLTDHLGSVVATLSDTGAVLSQQRYYPFGQVRDLPNDGKSIISQTDIGYTSQRNLDAQGVTLP
jgi:hypothetical protein